MKKILFLLAVILLVSCESRRKTKVKDTPQVVGEYLYFDMSNCLHTNKDCFAIRFSDIPLDEGAILNASELNTARILLGKDHSIHRIRKDELSNYELYYCCNRCISDSVYNELKKNSE